MQLESKLSKIIYVSCLTISLTALGSWAVLAHQDPPSGTTGQSKAERTDARFVHDAALASMAEIQLARLAAERAGSDVVKAFGERMIVQDGSIADQLKAAAQKENVTLPGRLSSRDQQTYDRLAHLSGSAFDRAYAQNMVDDHQKDLTAFQTEANIGKDDSFRAFADQSLPMIQEHLNQAREMFKTVSQTSSRTSSRASVSRSFGK
jgi:putative membrane protein